MNTIYITTPSARERPLSPPLSSPSHPPLPLPPKPQPKISVGRSAAQEGDRRVAAAAAAAARRNSASLVPFPPFLISLSSAPFPQEKLGFLGVSPHSPPRSETFVLPKWPPPAPAPAEPPRRHTLRLPAPWPHAVGGSSGTVRRGSTSRSSSSSRRMGAARGRVAALLVAALLLGAFAPPAAAASYPAKVVSGFVSNAASAVLKRLWSLKSTAKTASGAKSMVKYEGGYTVETVFDGSKLGIEPYAVEVTQGGELLVMDSMNSNIYRIALPLSRYSRPKLVAGSPEGIPGHIDGRLREAKMNHPKGFTVDGRGNIYVADAMNMAVRKISDAGVTTIAGGKSSRGGHVDGPSDDAKFSTDFEVRYIASSCSLLVIDRGNQAIREIQLNFDDCVYQYEAGFPLGVALLLAAAFFGYMLALLQRRVLGMVSTEDELQTPMKASIASIPPYQIQKPLKPSLRPPLIPNEDESEKQEVEEGFFTSLGKLIGGAKSSVAEIVRAAFSRKKRPSVHHYQQGRSSSWPVQESYAIPRDETPPVVDTRTPTPRKNYAFMSKEPEKIHHIRQGRAPYNGWNNGESPQQQQQVHHQQYLQHNRQYSLGPQTFYETSCEATNEIVFGAVQEVDSARRAVEIKPVNYGDAAAYEQSGLRYRSSGYMG